MKITSFRFPILIVFVVFCILCSCRQEERICPAGMEGKNCDIESRNRLLTTWLAHEQVNGQAIIYHCVISKGKQTDQVWLSESFAGSFFHHPVVARVSASTLTIPEQKPDGVASAYSVSGSCNYAAGVLYWNYVIVADATGARQSYSGTWTAD